MTKILVTGKYGQVARSLFDKETDHPNLELICAARKDGDVYLDLMDPQSIKAAVKEANPHIIINAAAYTAVDDAEKEPELAQRINGDAPGILAEEASKINARMIQLSTDYVFDGKKSSAYVESDQTNPIGVYGQSKLAGEINSRASFTETCIVRTSWVYSPYGKNFLKTMLRLAEDRQIVSVVKDQWGNPTSASEIADGLLKICKAWDRGGVIGNGETLHLAGCWCTNWSDFARDIFKLKFANDENTVTVKDISTSEYPTLAKRPANSKLDSSKFCSLFDFQHKSPEVLINNVLQEIA